MIPWWIQVLRCLIVAVPGLAIPLTVIYLHQRFSLIWTGRWWTLGLGRARRV